MSVPMICGLITSLLLVGSYFTYCVQAARKHSTPNLVTMLIMLPVTGLNAWTYLQMLSEDPFKAVSALSICALSFLMFGFLLWKKLLVIHWDWVSKLTAALTVCAFTVWLLSNATIGNLAVQVVLISAFAPILSGVIKGTLKEKPLPWILAVAAYAVSLIPLLAAHEHWTAFVFPLINGMLCNATIAILSVTLRKQRT